MWVFNAAHLKEKESKMITLVHKLWLNLSDMIFILAFKIFQTHWVTPPPLFFKINS